MTPTPRQIVYVAEYGAGARPAKVRFGYANDAGQERIIVDFTDFAGGWRDCFPSSVFDNEQDAAKAAE